MTSQNPGSRIYRGRSLEELVPQIRRDLGDDAIIVARRDTTSGGVGGFFAKREVEVEARPSPAREDAARLFAERLAEANEGLQQQPAQPHRPATSPEVDALPGAADVTVDDLFPPSGPQAGGLASLFNVGREEQPTAPAPGQAEGPAPAQAEGPAAVQQLADDQPAAVQPEGSAQQPVQPQVFPEPEAPPVAQEPAMIDQPSETEQSPVAEQPPVVEAPPAVRPPAPGEPMPLAEDPDAVGPPAMAEPPAAVVPPSMVEEPPAVEPPPYLEEPAVATPPVPAAAEPPASDVAPVQSGSAPVLPAAGLEAIDRLVARGLPADLAEAVAEQAAASLMPFAADADPAQLVGEALGRRIPLAFLRRAGGVVGFVGTAGAGKTRCVARLAAAHAQHGNLPVAVVALRSPDGGAELTRLLAPYDVALHAVDSGAEGAGRIAELRGTGLVIVDTPGVSPRSPEELQALGIELEALAPDELHLAVPATVAPMVARELIGGVRGLGVDAIVITHADETEQLGTVVGLAVESGVPLSYIARGQAVDAGLRPATATELAAALAS